MTDHIVKAYDQELTSLHALIRKMGELTIEQIDQAIQSIVTCDSRLARNVVTHDYEINVLETKVDELAIRILALRQPVASDLRTVVAALKISNQVERIADYGANIAKRALMIEKKPPQVLMEELRDLIKIPKRMIERSLAAFATNDLSLALHIWQMDHEVDDLYNTYLRHLFEEMISDPQNIGSCTQLLFAAKNIERIGDQSQNISEAVYTMITGKPFKESDVLKNDTED